MYIYNIGPIYKNTDKKTVCIIYIIYKYF